MTDFPVLQRIRVELYGKLADMKPHDPRRGQAARALVRATCRLMRRQVEARARPARPKDGTSGADLLTFIDAGGRPETESAHV